MQLPGKDFHISYFNCIFKSEGQKQQHSIFLSLPD